MTIQFNAKLYKIGSLTLLSLPKSASTKLPSRGMAMVEGNLNGFPFQTALEPDGKGSHLLRVDQAMLLAAHVDIGDTPTLIIKPITEWPEPKVPEDLKNALTANPKAKETWMDITPMARWDWIRWISSTKNEETRKKRIEKTFSKFKSGLRRPCCFNRTQCTLPDISKNGVVLEPTQTTTPKAK